MSVLTIKLSEGKYSKFVSFIYYNTSQVLVTHHKHHSPLADTLFFVVFLFVVSLLPSLSWDCITCATLSSSFASFAMMLSRGPSSAVDCQAKVYKTWSIIRIAVVHEIIWAVIYRRVPILISRIALVKEWHPRGSAADRQKGRARLTSTTAREAMHWAAKG